MTDSAQRSHDRTGQQADATGSRGHEPLAIVLVSELNRVIDTSVVINDASSGG